MSREQGADSIKQSDLASECESDVTLNLSTSLAILYKLQSRAWLSSGLHRTPNTLNTIM